MKSIPLEKMDVTQLVALFAGLATAQHEALQNDDSGEYNELYDRMRRVETQLRDRFGDQRRSLVPLLQHKDPQVRLQAAFATLAVAPDHSREALQMISNRNEYPQAADARGMLRALKEGAYRPA